MNRPISPRDVEFRRIIEGYIAVSGFTKDSIAKSLGITGRCFSDRLRSPGMFRLNELRRMCDMIRVKNEDRIKFL